MRQLQPRDNRLIYRLETREAEHFRQLLGHFPFTPPVCASVSRTDSRDEVCEREQLLNESLAEHRLQLRQLARELSGPEHLMELKSCWRLSVTPEQREFLLQVMNDIRVGCWEALGQPEPLPVMRPGLDAREYALISLMHLAGAFEHHLLEAPGEGVEPGCCGT